MVYNSTTNSLAKEDPNVPGVVLAVSPDNQMVLINDTVRKVFYLYKVGSGGISTFGGVGNYAQWTPDAKTLYVVGTDFSNPSIANGVPTLFVNNINTGWTTYPLDAPSTNLAITVPGVGAFLSGIQTVAHSWCPNLTPSPGYPHGQAYPLVAVAPAQTDMLGATIDGQHILGVGLDGGTTATLSDIATMNFASLVNGACPTQTSVVTLPALQKPLGIQATTITGVKVSPASNLAFVTFTTSGAGTVNLPYYIPNADLSFGMLGAVTLSGTPTAPIAGAFSLDDTIFFVSTSGDNLVHYVDVKSLTDTKQIKPGLVDGNGNSVPATLIAVRPRTTT